MLHLWLSKQTNKQIDKQTNKQTKEQTSQQQTNKNSTNGAVQYPWLLTQSSVVIPQGNSNTGLHYVLSKIPPVLVSILGHMTAAALQHHTSQCNA